jgi:thiosulfate dehydrogenase (quinone) large subunit
MPLSLAVLRAFLGGTFVFAGFQKLLDPNFLHPGASDFIGTQLHGFAHGTPVGGLLLFLDHWPVAVGIAIALAETAVGVATLFGIAPLLSAFSGLAVNAVLLLSATWHVHPYFLGSDSIYAIAWLAYGIGLLEMDRRSTGGGYREWRGSRSQRRRSNTHRVRVGRREVLRAGFVAGLALVMDGVAHALAGSPVGGVSARGPDRPRSVSKPATPSGGSGPPGSPPPAVPSGKTIASLDRMQIGEAIGFQAPGVGPAVLVRTAERSAVAYSRICTHAGCLVGYDTSARLLVCPCHGAEFDPARRGAPVAGPTSVPLQQIRVVVDPSSGAVILPS